MKWVQLENAIDELKNHQSHGLKGVALVFRSEKKKKEKTTNKNEEHNHGIASKQINVYVCIHREWKERAIVRTGVKHQSGQERRGRRGRER